MVLEPWKIMIGLSIVLAIFGLFIHFDVSSPAEAAFILVALGAIAVLSYIGYRIGNAWGKQRAK